SPLLVNVVSDEVASRFRIELDDLVRLKLPKRFIETFRGHEKPPRGGSSTCYFQKALFPPSMSVVFLVRRSGNLPVPNGPPEIRIAGGAVATRIEPQIFVQIEGISKKSAQTLTLR